MPPTLQQRALTEESCRAILIVIIQQALTCYTGNFENRGRILEITEAR